MSMFFTPNNFGMIFHATHEEASGVSPALMAAGVWENEVLNTVEENTIAGASLASNQITLPAGNYFISASHQYYRCGKVRLALYDTTAAAFVHYGQSQFIATGAGANLEEIWLGGKFSLSVASVVAVQKNQQSATYANGFPSGLGIPEKFGEVFLWQL